MRPGLQHGYIRMTASGNTRIHSKPHNRVTDDRVLSFTNKVDRNTGHMQTLVLRNVKHCKGMYDCILECNDGAEQVDVCIRWFKSQGMIFSDILDRSILSLALSKMIMNYPEPNYNMNPEIRRMLIASFINQGGALGDDLAEVVYAASLLGLKEIVSQSTVFLSSLGAAEVCSPQELVKFVMADSIVKVTSNCLLVSREVELRIEDFTFQELDVVFKCFSRLSFFHPAATAAVVSQSASALSDPSAHSHIVSICVSLCSISITVPGVASLACQLISSLYSIRSDLSEEDQKSLETAVSSLKKVKSLTDSEKDVVENFLKTATTS